MEMKESEVKEQESSVITAALKIANSISKAFSTKNKPIVLQDEDGEKKIRFTYFIWERIYIFTLLVHRSATAQQQQPFSFALFFVSRDRDRESERESEGGNSVVNETHSFTYNKHT